MEWKNQLEEYLSIVNRQLDDYFSIPEDKNKKVVEAMKYSMFAGGKRLRPVLALASYNLFADDLNKVMPYACGLEMIHTYSLVHDDLPAMDNDDYRRGKLTNHKVFGEGMAILAGDGLLNYSYEVMLRDALKRDEPKPYLRSINEIAKAAGIYGMIGGQTVDLESEGKAIDADTLDYIHHNKTAALITVPLKIGAIIAGASEKDIENMAYVGQQLGLAFQIKDDILDIVGDQEKLGKKTGSDQDNEKSTYPSLHGLEFSINKVRELTNSINEILSTYGEKGSFLYHLSQYLIDRET
ncbi:polyprenyl synthetase family protein [Alkaliphilus transvaalensis]|uniref:polyprenyl synthetase family protein n=1 Tax=Alkaliphilus transvaalensis TaxID=114628 RepID=UPI00047BA0BA|nr:farnesyl diphosphate synthase [Alkaliphilus transvaalensis]